MSGVRYLADTNAFIYLLQKHPALRPLIDFDWYYSFITEIELLGKPGIKQNEVKLVRSILHTAIKVVHVNEINEIAIRLKQQYLIKTPDALIAATAIYTGLPLLTADSGFSRISTLD